MSTLDAFLQPQVVKPKQDPGVYIQQKCSDCGKLLGAEPWTALRIKGEVKPYCRECARKHLPKPKPKETEEENKEEGCINSHTVFRRNRKW